MIFQTPQEWEMKPLKKICDVIMGQAPTSDSYNQDNIGTPLIAGAADLGEKYPKPKKHTTAPTRLSKNGDIILCVRATIGDMNWSDGIYCYGRGVTGIRVKKDTDAEFIYFWLLANKRYLLSLGRGATFKQISKVNIQNLQTPKLSLSEQRRIVARIKECLDRVDEIRKLRRESLKESENLLRATRREYLGTSDKIPEKWKEIRLDEKSDVIYGISAAIAKNRDPSLGPPIIRMANMTLDGYLNLSDLRYQSIPKGKEEHYLLKPGDLLLNWRSGSSRHVGKTAIFNEDGKFTCASFILRIRVKGEKANNRYLRHVLNFMRAEGIFEARARMQINSKLNAKEFAAFIIRFPQTLDEQEKIADALDQVGAMSREITENSKATNEEISILIQGILQKAFSGKL